MRADPAVVEGLGVLCAAREALLLDELQTVAIVDERTDRRQVLKFEGGIAT